ncbi:MAG: 4Fe-4S dicluster domain-containing protein [Kiritimatiellia bacterium]|nr:4Fe-4S dicluster domain-containing protein [Kiritimatiellia bacterium]
MSTCYQIKVLKIFCKGCELCVSICPRKALTLSQNVNKSGFHFPESDCRLCSGCKQCAIICPDAAIEIFRINEKAKKNKY